ncbi:hypothetical protein P691DRAFT_790486 [Macrolepiota fuliginosa MF-IS2]|uniref:NACHT domain-containing protein n=1 Tax=Macrolepiota fuliginosa MF-IS2 TaxID=1400762 RepID=A0A9P5WZT6_9AGAR|nr:hypothetical protein P691DRAFT_790486 [Macrolepiota fuliginosa MF-IS2]
MPLFADSQNTTINNSNFVDQLINNNVTMNISFISRQTGIDIPLEASNPNATHDSSACDYAPQCHPGTHKQYIKDIVDWGAPTVGANDPLPLLWMRGLAGIGKSAIAQMCAKELKKLGRLGAAFFFVVNRIHHDRMILQKTMAMQFKMLINEPFQELEKAWKGIGWRMVIIVDGLDECKNINDQSRIVNIIAAAACDSVMYMVLLLVSNDTNSNIELYLCNGFKNTLWHCNIPVTSQWPSDDNIQALVKAAKGLFIYAAMVLWEVSQAGSPSEALCMHAAPAFIEELKDHVHGRLGGLIHFYHKSFYDFLVDPTCSGPFYIWSSPMHNVCFKHCLEITLKYEESYCFQGSAHGVADSASSLSWPYTNELVNSVLKACVYEWAFDACFQWGDLPEIEHQLLQRFGRANFRKVRQNQVIKRWKECRIIQPYHPTFGSRFKPLFAKKSQDKLISGLFRMGHGPGSNFWYWEVNLKEEYYQEFTAADLAEGEKIYREERFDLWPTESWRQ